MNFTGMQRNDYIAVATGEDGELVDYTVFSGDVVEDKRWNHLPSTPCICVVRGTKTPAELMGCEPVLVPLAQVQELNGKSYSWSRK